MTSETTGNRYSLPPNNGSANYWLARGLSFQNEAAAQIRACLQSHGFDMQEMYQALLMSLLSMVTISVTSGKLSSAHTYLQGAGKLIQRYQLARSSLPSWKSRSLTALHQIYLYLQTIHSSTHISWASCSGKNIDTESSSNSGFIKEVHGLAACGSQPSVTPQTNFDSLLDYGGDRQLLTNIYGVPYSLLKLIGRASELAKEVEEHGETVHDTTGFRLRCEKLEDDICTYQSSPSNGENLTSNFRPDDTCMQISSHLAHAMHDALIVMFFRRVRKVHRAVLQHHVKSTLGHLKDQEAIKTGAGIHAPALLWPWFMVAAEATGEDLREEARQWSGVAMRYGGRNIEAAEQVVREVWRRHDQRLSRATWVDVVREWAVSLVLT
ncbi:hypothetical protein MAP00_006685 [Monascus purpureus]|nr:hypothetical protein MAP00_006685 [Monascus purpureus]